MTTLPPELDALVAQAEEPELYSDQKSIEDTLLTGLFTSPDARDLVLKVSPRDFYFSLHRAFAAQVWPTLRSGGHVDRVTFFAQLPRAEALRMKPEEYDQLKAVAAAVFTKAQTDALNEIASPLKASA